MQLHSDEAILLEVADLHDYDRIVTFLARQSGKKRGVARGARRKHSRFGGQLQPLARVRVSWFEKEERDLVRIGSVDLERAAERLHADLEGILLGGYLADQMREFAQENESGERLFRLLASTLDALDAGVDQSLAARYYEAWMLRLAGIFPPPVECPECGRPLEERGASLPADGEGLVCRDCGRSPGARPVGAELLDFLRRIGREGLAAMARRPPSPATLERAESLSATIRRRFLQHELKSYRVMQRTLASFR